MLREMTLADVLSFLQLTDDLGITVWLDGGWSVDAVLGEQSRWHEDLDITIDARDSAQLVHALSLAGFEPVPRPDTRPWNFVYGDARGREIDFHLVEFDADGNGQFGPVENGESYPAEALAGRGVIGDRLVRCISPSWMVGFHTGYEPAENDWLDVSRLCARFDIPIPPEYDKFRWTR